MDITYFNSLMTGITLAAVTLAVIALITGLAYYGLRINQKVNDLEKGYLAFQSRITEYLQNVIRGLPKTDNPGHDLASKREVLLAKLRTNEISRTEAMELNDILVKEKEAAEKRGDTVALIAIILGLALLAAVLAKSK